MSDADTPTPRTNAAALGFARIMVDWNKDTCIELVDSNFARTLERELAACQREMEELRDTFDLLADDADALKKERKRAEQAEAALEQAREFDAIVFPCAINVPDGWHPDKEDEPNPPTPNCDSADKNVVGLSDKDKAQYWRLLSLSLERSAIRALRGAQPASAPAPAAPGLIARLRSDDVTTRLIAAKEAAAALEAAQGDGRRMDWMERNLCRAGEVKNSAGQTVKLARVWSIMGELETLRETVDAAIDAAVRK